MPPRPPHRWLTVHQVGAVTIVRFTQPRLLDESQIESVGESLVKLVQEEPARKLVLSLGGVNSMVSSMLAKLVIVYRKAKTAGARVVLCTVEPRLLEVLKTLHLTRLFTVLEDEQEAIESLS